MVKVPTKSIERNLLTSGFDCIAAVDEVGMGCLAGPVVVCAVLFRPKFYRSRRRKLEYLRDSKNLLAHQRERYARELSAERHVRHAIAVIHPREVDRLNVFGAARAGMRRSLRRLGLKRADRAMVLVDGRSRLEGIPWEQMPIVKGDRKVFSIAAASVLAKVHRDRMMAGYAKRYPAYGFEKHKGYATRLHQRRLTELGPTPLHRRSFRLTYEPKGS